MSENRLNTSLSDLSNIARGKLLLSTLQYYTPGKTYGIIRTRRQEGLVYVTGLNVRGTST